MYEKFSTFLRVEACCNKLKDFRLNRGLDNRGAIRQKLAEVTDRFAGFEAPALNVPIDFPLLQRLALPVVSGRTKIPGIKIEAAYHKADESLQLNAFSICSPPEISEMNS